MLCCPKSSFVCSLLLNLDPCDRNDLYEMFSIFYKKVARELASKLAIFFRYLVKVGSFQPVGDCSMLSLC